MQQTLTINPLINNMQQQPQHHHQYHQLTSHQSPHEDQLNQPQQHQQQQQQQTQHILPEQQQLYHRPQYHHQQQHHPNHQGYNHLPSSTTMSPPLTNTTSSSLNGQALTSGGGLYTPVVTSQGLSQYCSSTDTALLNCGSATSTTSSSSSSASSSPSHDSDSPSSPSSNFTDKRSTPSIGVNLRVTGQCSQGGRKYMEDYFSVAYQQSENAKDLEYAFIGIYDGHGGAEAATFAKEHLMMEIINQRLFWSDSDHDVLRAIREGYIATHYAMWREQDKWPKTANGLPSTAGTTATVAFIRREKIYIGHVGDSGIVLGYQNENENIWRAKQLTVDHKPESTEERTRIMKSGGKVVVKSGVPRVVWNRPRNANHRGPIKRKTPVDEIPFLAVARSLGDLWSYNSERNEFVVSPDPDVKVIPINPKTFRCLIFGTDGLWNVINPMEAVNTVREKEFLNEHLQAQRGDSPHEGNQWTNPSKSLVDKALKTWSSKKMRADNTSVVTVILYPPGQGGHNNNVNCHNTLATPPSFVQPASYGLEYTQVQAKIPAYDDATTYKEMAMKYLPPEEYRNFNYYADDSDHAEEADTDDSEEEEAEVAMSAKYFAVPDEAVNHNGGYPLHTNTWDWQQTGGLEQTSNVNVTNAVAEDEEAEDEDVDEMDEDDEDEEEEDVAIEIVPSGQVAAAVDAEVNVIDYRNYLQMDAEEANNATDAYINTFTETYNSLLTSGGQTECLNNARVTNLPAAPAAIITPTNSNSNSSSNSSNCQSVSPPNMHALIEEQQLYQQQCMSQEDGYSLTKLETRREQQTCKSQSSQGAVDVETFKIFHHQQNSQTTLDGYSSNATERYYQQHTGFMPQLQQKPLELHSLLQQEREEEQQVAYERLQMQNKLQDTGHQTEHVSAYACLQAVPHDAVCSYATTAAVPSMLERATNPMELDEEDEAAATLVVELTTAEMEAEEEPSVQINEISSSSSCGEDSTVVLIEEEDDGMTFIAPALPMATTVKAAKVEHTQEVVYQLRSPQKLTNDTTPRCFADKSLHARRATLKLNKNNSCLPPLPPSPILLTTSPAKSSNCKRSRSFLFANVPNENMDRVVGYRTPKAHRRSLSLASASSSKMNCSGMLMTPPAAASTPMISRQLRSNTSHCIANTPLDYGKRTLRTRNSLAKDMKAKSSLVQAALKYQHNSVTRKFLRTSTAAALLAGANPAVLIQDEHMTPTNRRSLHVNNNGGHSSVQQRSIKTTRNSNTNTPAAALSQQQQQQQQSAHHLNLRSRQCTAVPTPTTPQMLNLNSTTLDSLDSGSPPTSTPSTPVIKRASLADRRTLRSMHTRSSSRSGPSSQANFSKTTRSQSTGTQLAAPPPSPKMINAAAVAVAAATRARSLLTQKHAAAVNGRRSVVAAVFGKRNNLRSNGLTTHGAGGAATRVNMIPVSSSSGGGSGAAPTTTTMGATSSTHQTLRGRIVKKFKR